LKWCEKGVVVMEGGVFGERVFGGGWLVGG
jgi:hypothetical protein